MGERQKLTKANLGITEGLPLQASDGGIEELRADIQRLMDIEAIKQLKYAYFRCVDTCNLEELANLFHDRHLVPRGQYVDPQPQRQDLWHGPLLGSLPESGWPVADQGDQLRAGL